MRFSVGVGVFRSMLQEVSFVTPVNADKKFYEGVFIEFGGDGELMVVGSNGDDVVVFRELLGFGDGFRKGSVLIKPRPLLAYLGQLGAGDVVVVEKSAAGDLLVGGAGGDPYVFRSWLGSFPRPDVGSSDMIRVNFGGFGEGLSAVKFTTARKDAAVVQLLTGPDGVFLCSTDGYRLSRAVLDSRVDVSSSSIIFLSILDRVSRMDVKAIQLDSRGRKIWFHGDNFTVRSKLSSQPFPEVSNILSVMPSDPVAVLDRKVLRAAVSKLTSIAEDSPVEVLLEGDRVVLAVRNDSLGEGREFVSNGVSVKNKLEFKVGLGFLREALEAHQAGEVSLFFGGFEKDPLYVVSKGVVEVTTILALIS